MERGRDAFSALAQRRRGFKVERLADCLSLGEPYRAALHENNCTPVPEQVAFRCDFPAWLSALCDRDRGLVDELVVGERTLDVARRFGLTPGRVSQLRRRFHGGWEVFCSEGAGVN